MSGPHRFHHGNRESSRAGTAVEDPGVFGPASVSWRVHADPAAFIGGVSALLMQALHPRAMRLLAAHSDFRSDPWGRLQRTAEYIAVITYGTTAEATAAAGRVRMVHRRLGADDPHLLAWVHVTFVHCILDAVRRAGLALTRAEQDQYVDEQRHAAALIGIDPELAPRSVAEVGAYLHDVRPLLRATPEARAAAGFVLLPPMPGTIRWLTPAQPAWAGVATTAFLLLPRWARACYGGGSGIGAFAFAGGPIRDIQGTVSVRALRRAALALPESVRTGPHLTAARERLAGVAADSATRISAL